MRENFTIDPIGSLEKGELEPKESPKKQLENLRKELQIPPEKLKTITNREFLNIPTKERLQYVTRGNIDYTKVANGNVKEVTFFFDQDKNGKDDSNLYKMTTLGQVMGPEVSSVECNGNIYTRAGLDGEFFNGNRRLTIHTDTTIKIDKPRTSEEINNIKKQNIRLAKNYKEFDQDFTQEALERNIKNKETLLILSKALSSSKNTNKQISIEEIFTQYDRIRDKFGLSNNNSKIKKLVQEGYVDFENNHQSGYEKYKDLVDKVTAKYPKISSSNLRKLIDKENSKWDPNLKARLSSAYGLGQIIDSTWARYGRGDRSNPKNQLEATCRYLSHIMETKECSIEIAMAYYNTGESILNITDEDLQKFAKNNFLTITKRIE